MADLEAGGTRLVNSRHFTMDESNDCIVDWTADSKTVIVVVNRGGDYEIQRQFLSGDPPETIMSGAGSIEHANVSPDGKWVIVRAGSVSGGPSTPVQLMRVPITGGSPELIFQVS